MSHTDGQVSEPSTAESVAAVTILGGSKLGASQQMGAEVSQRIASKSSAGKARIRKLVTRVVGCTESGEEVAEGGSPAPFLKVSLMELHPEEEIMEMSCGDKEWVRGAVLKNKKLDAIEGLVLRCNGVEYASADGKGTVFVVPHMELPATAEIAMVWPGLGGSERRVEKQSLTLQSSNDDRRQSTQLVISADGTLQPTTEAPGCCVVS